MKSDDKTENEKFAKIENEIANLPRGTIVHRTIRGVKRFYHQWRENGQTKSRYLASDEILPLREKIEHRENLRAQLRSRKNSRWTPCAKSLANFANSFFATTVICARGLDEFCAFAKNFSSRTACARACEIMHAKPIKPLVVSGEKDVGKSIFLAQIFANFSAAEREKSALIILTPTDTFANFRHDCDLLHRLGVRFLFVDNLANCREADSILTFIRDVLSPRGIACACAVRENFADEKFARIPLAHIRESPLLRDACATPARAREFLCTHISDDAFSRFSRISRNLLLEENESVATDDLIARGYLLSCREESIAKNKKIGTRFLFTYSDLHRVIGRDMIANLLASETFATQGAAERKRAREVLLESLDERILEDSIIAKFLATRASETIHVNALVFPTGGRLICVANENDLTCELYAVKNTRTRDERLLIDLADPRKLDAIEHRFGLITAREIFYHGRTAHHATGVRFRALADVQ